MEKDSEILAKVKGWFEAAATNPAYTTWREEARTAWDFYDGAQWSAEETDKLAENGQPALVVNKIATKVDNLAGTEIAGRTRIVYRSRSGNAADEEAATALTDTSKGRDRSRYLYGCTDTNWNTAHATALASVDATNDKLTTATISRAKRKALLDGTRKVRPFVLKNGNKVEEVYVLFAHPLAVRDLLADADFKALNTYIPTTFGDSVLVHGQRYKGMWDGVMIFETEMPTLAGAGASGINVAHNVLCGAQAAAIAWGKRTNYKEDVDDYGHQNGFAIDEIRGVSKLVFNGVDHGIVNVFTAAVAD